MNQKLIILFYYLYFKYALRFKSRSHLNKWQEKRIQQHLKTILKRSSYYKNLYHDYDLEDLKRLPIIGKQEMMEHFDQLVTIRLKKKKALEIALRAEKERDFSAVINGITVGLSSGTSGNRGLFAVSRKERYQWVGAILARMLPGSIFKPWKIAFFLRADSNLYETVNRSNITFRYFDMMIQVDDHLEELNALSPDILIAPPSVLIQLAERLGKKNLTIRPQRIISVAEVLEDFDRKRIETAFRQRLHQVYQATEGFLAHTCSHGTLHLNEDTIHIEKEYVEKDSGRFSPIITDFRRSTQPIFRYRLNDILVEKKSPCPCGSAFTALERVEGRCDDLFIVSGRDGSDIVVYPDYIHRAMMTVSEQLTQYKVEQNNRDQITVRYQSQSGEDLSPEIINAISRMIERLNGKVPRIGFGPYLSPENRKLKRVERLFQDEL